MNNESDGNACVNTKCIINSPTHIFEFGLLFKAKIAVCQPELKSKFDLELV